MSRIWLDKLPYDQTRHVALIARIMVGLIYLGGLFYLATQPDRTAHLSVLGTWAVVSIGYLLLNYARYSLRDWRWIVALGCLAVVSQSIHVPQLSDDYHRFLWDGAVMNHGLHPYGATPRMLMEDGQLTSYKATFEAMNSPDYYAVYSPLLVGYYALCAHWSERTIGFILLVRIPYILSYILLILGLYKICRHVGYSPSRMGWIILHPLLLVEGLGQLHIEAVMITPMVWAGYAAMKCRGWTSASYGAMAASIKLTAGLAWPFLLPLIGWRRWLYGSGLYLILLFLGYAYLLPEGGLINYVKSLRLYYASFEFNASIYYLCRWLGQLWVGYNPIAYIGPMLGGLFLSVVLYWWLRSSRRYPMEPVAWARMLTWIYMIYLACSTTVHPWYLLPALVWLPLSGMRSVLIWSLLMPLSYIAYKADGTVVESTWLLIVIYAVIAAAMMYDIFHRPMMDGQGSRTNGSKSEVDPR